MTKRPRKTDNPPAAGDKETGESAPSNRGRGGKGNHEEMVAIIGKKVLEQRKARHLSQAQLARAAEVPTSTMFSVENGQHNTSIVTLRKIADALGVDLRELLPGKSLPAPTDQDLGMLKLVESAIQATLGEMNRTSVMVQHVLKMVQDIQQPPASPKKETEH